MLHGKPETDKQRHIPRRLGIRGISPATFYAIIVLPNALNRIDSVANVSATTIAFLWIVTVKQITPVQIID